MLRPKRLAIDHLPHPLLLAAYYPIFFARQLPDFAATVLNEDLPLVGQLDLAGVRTSDTLFILGSGGSISDIDDERWEQIERHDTVGFNFWIAHRHVPTFYTFEALNLDVNDGLRRETTIHYEREMKRREEAYRDVPKIITDLLWDRLEFFGRVPDGFKENLYAMPTIPMFARTPSELDFGLKTLDRLGLFDAQSRIATAFKFRATLSFLVSLAVNMGYRRIVTCGVDLNNSRYFFHDPELYGELANFALVPKGQPHLTQRSHAVMPKISEILMQMKALLLEPRGIDLMVESASSLLHQELGLEVWKA